jgi:hypothetical protein
VIVLRHLPQLGVGGRRRVRVEPGPLEVAPVVEEAHRLGVHRQAVGLAAPDAAVGDEGAGQERLLEAGGLRQVVVERLGPAGFDLLPRLAGHVVDVGRVAALEGELELVRVLVGEDLDLDLDPGLLLERWKSASLTARSWRWFDM